MRFEYSPETSSSLAEGSSPFLKIDTVGSGISSATHGPSIASVAGKNRAPTKQCASASEPPRHSSPATARLAPAKSSKPGRLGLQAFVPEHIVSPHVRHGGPVVPAGCHAGHG